MFIDHARDNRFLGWADIPLTDKGEVEARKAASVLSDFGIEIDEIFCSYLKRSIKSAWLLADEMDQVRMVYHELIESRVLFLNAHLFMSEAAGRLSDD